MKIKYHLYQLTPKDDRWMQKRAGALLRVDFGEGLIGFADCHPWTTLGDLSLSDQLRLLSEGCMTPLTSRSLHFANLDAQARFEGSHLFEGLSIPPNHAFLGNLSPITIRLVEEAAQDGFEEIKLKLGDDLPSEVSLLKKLLLHFAEAPLLFRLDFNLKLTFKQWREFMDQLGPARRQIAFCEDPFTFNVSQWEIAQTVTKTFLACDLQSEQAIGLPQASAFLVCKPAVQDETLFMQHIGSSQKWIITSYLDHPLGQMSAAYVAAKAHQRTPNQLAKCGLLSHHVYSKNAFSDSLSCIGPRLLPTAEGSGFGFDDSLRSLEWRRL